YKVDGIAPAPDFGSQDLEHIIRYVDNGDGPPALQHLQGKVPGSATAIEAPNRSAHRYDFLFHSGQIQFEPALETGIGGARFVTIVLLRDLPVKLDVGRDNLLVCRHILIHSTRPAQRHRGSVLASIPPPADLARTPAVEARLSWRLRRQSARR